MTLEWIPAGICIALALSWFFRANLSGRSLVGVCVLALGASAGLAALWNGTVAQPSIRKAEFLRTVPTQSRPGGYRASGACESCHPSQHDSWHRSFHRTMTQVAAEETVVGNFNNVTLTLSNQTYRLTREGDAFFADVSAGDPASSSPPVLPASARLQSLSELNGRYRIGLLTGSHHMQAYWLRGDGGNLQFLFPFAWLIAEQRWAPLHNTFLRDPAIPVYAQYWNRNCINCHATGGQARPDAATASFQTRAAELGISCEACHGPGEKHIEQMQDPLARYAQHLGGTNRLSIVNPATLDHRRSADACGQCHGIHWIPNAASHAMEGSMFRPGMEMAKAEPIVQPTRLKEQPWLHEPLRKDNRWLRDRYWADGVVRVSGREYNGLIDSPCYIKGEMSCLSCHSMHDPISTDDQLGRRMDGNQACIQCHAGIGAKLTEHTHHAPGSAGSSCYNCHMPHTTYGLLKAIRSHRVGSPSVRESLVVERPNACNLCHLDKTLQWTGEHLQRWYGQRPPALGSDEQTVAASLLWLHKGDAGLRALAAWHLGWEPARQASGQDWIAPHLASTLNDPYSAVRFIAHRSLKSLGQAYTRIPYDFVDDAARLEEGTRSALSAWLTQGSARANDAVLIRDGGGLDLDGVERLRKQRNNISIDLQE